MVVDGKNQIIFVIKLLKYITYKKICHYKEYTPNTQVEIVGLYFILVNLGRTLCLLLIS